jgi:LysR family transcriptional regulator, nitrogen assimilation regulatory protein
MDIRHLRYFIAIAEEGSLSKAAERLRVAQPALSQHMRNMEMDLSTELLFRSSRGVQLTESGERLLAQARKLVGQFDLVADIVRGTDLEPAGEVRFGIPGTVSEVLSARLIQETARRYPRIRLRIAEAMSGFILDWLREGKVDIAVLYRGADRHGLTLSEVLSEELLLFGGPQAHVEGADGPGATVPFCEAIRLPLAVPSPGHGLRELLDGLATHHCAAALNVRTEIDSYTPIKALVEQGFGFSILPAMAIRKECAAGRLKSWPLSAPQVRRTVFVAMPADRPPSTATAAVEALCLEVLRQLVREGAWDATLIDG